MENNKHWFFGSKLNTALLVVLIILMIIALWWMSKNKELYFGSIQGQQLETKSGVPVPNTKTQIKGNVNGSDYQPNKPDLKKTPIENPKPTTTQAPKIVADLYARDKNVAIAQCSYNGQVVYSVDINAYDGGGYIVDANGKTINSTQGFTGKTENDINPINCTDIYVTSPNIWGRAVINKYNLK